MTSDFEIMDISEAHKIKITVCVYIIQNKEVKKA